MMDFQQIDEDISDKEALRAIFYLSASGTNIAKLSPLR
jgi:hypothetical protein